MLDLLQFTCFFLFERFAVCKVLDILQLCGSEKQFLIIPEFYQVYHHIIQTEYGEDIKSKQAIDMWASYRGP